MGQHQLMMPVKLTSGVDLGSRRDCSSRRTVLTSQMHTRTRSAASNNKHQEHWQTLDGHS